MVFLKAQAIKTLMWIKRARLRERSWNKGNGMIERIETGARSSKIVKHNGVAYLTGQVAEGDTIQDQVRTCLDKIDALLIKAGSSRENMLRVTIWLADMKDFAGLNEVWNDWVPEGHAPARACGEAKLARAELKVEFIVDAAYD
jgi:enamine deaminase RidA (YjgF/YER057c/UK114 family)